MREPRVDECDIERRSKNWDLSKEMYNKINFESIINNCSTRRELIIDYMILYNKEVQEAINCTLKKGLDEEKKLAELAFKSTAVINVRKFPGGIQHDGNELSQAYKEFNDLLLDQIELINPDVIICGNTLQLFEDKLDFRKGIRKPIEGIKNHHYFCLPNRLYINLYHPSNEPFKNTSYEKNYINQIRLAFEDWKENFCK